MIALGSMPADFEKQSALVLGCNELVELYPRTMLRIMSALIHKIPILAVVATEEQRQHAITLMADWGLSPTAVQFVSLPVTGMWIRDYGPIFVRKADGSILVLDAQYLETDRPNDDRVPTDLGNLLKLNVRSVPLVIEGGNLISNGRGLAVSTSTLIQRNQHTGLDAQGIGALLGRNYGLTQWCIVHPLVSDFTGHADMFLTFTSPDTVVVGQYDPRIDPVNADVLDANAAILASTETPSGRLNVVRIPMPTNHGSLFRTYTNVIYANGTLLMPTYGGIDPEGEAEAKRIYRRLLPDWQIVGIDATEIIDRRGALRCVSLNIPWLEEVFLALSDDEALLAHSAP